MLFFFYCAAACPYDELLGRCEWRWWKGEGKGRGLIMLLKFDRFQRAKIYHILVHIYISMYTNLILYLWYIADDYYGKPAAAAKRCNTIRATCLRKCFFFSVDCLTRKKKIIINLFPLKYNRHTAVFSRVSAANNNNDNDNDKNI